MKPNAHTRGDADHTSAHTDVKSLTVDGFFHHKQTETHFYTLTWSILAVTCLSLKMVATVLYNTAKHNDSVAVYKRVNAYSNVH